MLDEFQSAPAQIGHNNPPEQTPFEAARERIGLLRVEAGNWLDGAPISTQAQADTVQRLIRDAQAARKDADAARKADKKPHADAAKAVDAQYKPIIETADDIAEGGKKLLAPFLAAIEAEKRRKAGEERRKAEEARRVAEEARRAAEATDIAAREDAARLAEEAQDAETRARRAESSKAKARSGSGRAMTLRTVYRPHVVDYVALCRHLWEAPHLRDALKDFALEIAQREFRAGRRSLPGVECVEEQVAQ